MLSRRASFVTTRLAAHALAFGAALAHDGVDSAGDSAGDLADFFAAARRRLDSIGG